MIKKDSTKLDDIVITYLRLLSELAPADPKDYLDPFLNLLLPQVCRLSFSARRETQFLITTLGNPAGALVLNRVQGIIIFDTPDVYPYSFDILGRRLPVDLLKYKATEQVLYLLDVLCELVPAGSGPIAGRLIYHREPEIRARACTLAGRTIKKYGTGAEPGIKELASCLGDPSPAVRVRCAHALGETGIPESVPYLVKALSDRVYHVRNAAMHALVKYDPAGVFPALWHVVQENRDRFAVDKVVEFFQLYDSFLVLVKGAESLDPALDPALCRQVLDYLRLKAGDEQVEERIKAVRPLLSRKTRQPSGGAG